MAIFNLTLNDAVTTREIPDTKKGGVLRKTYYFDLVTTCPGMTTGDTVIFDDKIPFKCGYIWARKRAVPSAADIIDVCEKFPGTSSILFLTPMDGFLNNSPNASNVGTSGVNVSIGGRTLGGDDFRVVIGVQAATPTLFLFAITFGNEA